MLQPSNYPEDAPVLNKLRNLEAQSKWLGGKENFYRVPLTSFFTKTRNKAGVEMQANEGSGNESTGLNDGSKNSIPTTYLTDTWNWGAEIFCGCEVRFIEKALDDKGYIVHFAFHGKGRQSFSEAFHNQLFWVKAVGCMTLQTFSPVYSLTIFLRMTCVSSALVQLERQKYCFALETLAYKCLRWSAQT
jgi:hypothetical protein